MTVTVRVERHNGPAELIEIESFDAQEVAMQMNSSSVVGIAIGNQVFSRIDIKHVKQVGSEDVIV